MIFSKHYASILQSECMSFILKAHLFQACPELAACVSWALLWQRQRKCGLVPDLYPQPSAPQPESWHNGLYAASWPEERLMEPKNYAVTICDMKTQHDRTNGWLTYILHVLRFVCWRIPAVIEDEDVGFWQTFIYFVEKMFFLDHREELVRMRLNFRKHCFCFSASVLPRPQSSCWNLDKNISGHYQSDS